ncbi:MAG: leucine-rich repeat protein [Kiritimatiellae bacterium]|nr:leucine-rich repeat protein [Kiritimatiellia bacterium]
MKKILLILLSCVLGFYLPAETETIDGIEWTYQVSNGEAQIYKDYWSPVIPSSTCGAITIPSTLGGYSVTSIGDSAFRGCSSLTSVTIPSSVTSIGDCAFLFCSSLTSVTIPSSVTFIGGNAFYGCTNLWKDTNGVQYESDAKVVLIQTPTSLTGEFLIPNSVRFIHSEAFYDCSGLTSVTIPSSVISIGDSAFRGCSGLTSVTIPSSVTSIGYQAFYSCSSLTSVTIPEGVTTIEFEAFCGCSSLTSVTIPEGVTSIGWDAFLGCSSLTSVHISDLEAWCKIKLGSATSNPLGYAKKLYLNGNLVDELNIPSSVTSIGFAMFYNCESLTSVTIPEGVTSIGGSAFSGCTGLISVIFLGDVPLVKDSPAFESTKGYYTSQYASEWEEVIAADGTWNGLAMRCMEAGKLFTLTFDANGGEGGQTLTQAYGTTFIAPTVTREGYAFVGWYPTVPSKIPAQDVTYTAQWKINQYSITFDAAGGEGGTSVTQDYGSSLTAPTVTREGYTFTSWSPTVPTTVPAANATYTAQWQINQYTITFDAAGGEGGTSVTQDYGSSLITPTVTREGYTFIGWSPEVPTTVPAANATYTAQWKINQYTITFDAVGGEGGTSVTQDYGSSLTAPTVTREGYTFIGWSPTVPVTVPATNATYTAQWRANQYTQTFDANGGEGGASLTQDYASSLIAPTVTREGYTFIGWSPEVPTTVPAMNATYTAQWRINQYTITFDAAGGEGGTSVTQEYGSSLTAPTVTREGHRFLGWLPEVPSITPAENAIYVAQWAKVYEVTINCKGDGTVSGEGWYQPGASVVLTATPDEGVTFCGWDGFKKTAEATISFVMPEEDVVLSAYFAKSSALDAYLSTHENSGGDADDLDSLVEAEIAKRDLHTADEMKEMVVDTPVIEAKNGVVTIRLQVKDGAASEVMDGGEVSVEITPKAGEKAGFYKFVVPDEQ